jgi:hypothetical protein
MELAAIFAIEKIVTFEAGKDIGLFCRVFWLKSNSEIALEDETLSSQAERIEQVRKELGKRPER